MKATITRRLKAFLIDYVVIVIYILLLLGATLFISKIFSLNLEKVNPTRGELVGFVTLTLPVILYFTLSENGKYRGSLGKKRYGLQVVSSQGARAGLGQLLMRNIFKFLPWELAHFFVFQLFYFKQNNTEAPAWVLNGLITCQALAIVYLLFMLFNKNNRSIYELFSGTCVIQTRTAQG